MKNLLLPLTILGSVLTSEAQRKEVAGIVISKESGQTVTGTLVWVKSTNQGLVTGVEGYFDLNVNPGDTIELTRAGYKTKEVLVDDANLYKIEIERDGTEKVETPVIIRSDARYSRGTGKNNR